MSTWADVEAVGYRTEVVALGVRCVTRDGVLIYVRDDDQEMIDALANPPASGPVEMTGKVAGPSPIEAIAALDPKTATIADVIEAVQSALG